MHERDLDSFIAEVDAAGRLDVIERMLQREVERAGFDCFAYVLHWPPEGPRKPFYMSSYPRAWIEHYLAQGYRDIDPLWNFAAYTARPFLWKDVLRPMVLGATQKQLFAEAVEAGIRSGAGFPLHGPRSAMACLHIASDLGEVAFRALYEKQRHMLHLMALNVHHAIARLSWSMAEASAQLSPRQSEVLLWSMRGKTYWEIGEILGISADTVRQHIMSACRALDAENKTQAVARALAQKLIVP